MIEDKGNTSDGYHTFNELYEHRCLLFISLMCSHQAISWRAKKHEDGTMYDGWFVAGMHLNTGDISYHLPLKVWSLLDGKAIQTFELSPKWDGHTAQDTIERVKKYIEEYKANVNS